MTHLGQSDSFVHLLCCKFSFLVAAHVASGLSLPRIWLSRSTDDDETLCLGPQATGLRCRRRRLFLNSDRDRETPHRAGQRHSAKTRH